MQMAPSDIFQRWADAAEETAQGLGMGFQAFFCDGSDEAWLETAASLVTQEMVLAEGVDLTNLDTVAGPSYSDRRWMPTSDWMGSEITVLTRI